MARPVPPHLVQAMAQVSQVLQQALGKPVDLLKDPWASIEPGVARLLGGPFDLRRPEHQTVALGLACAFGERLCELGAGFWFPNREVPEGAMVGFPDGIVMVAPLGAVIDCLSKASLPRLEEIGKEIQTALGRARFGMESSPRKLDAQAYARLFDPGFVQFVLLDGQKAQEAWAKTPDALARDLRDALTRVGPEFTKEARAQAEQQLVGGLTRMDPAQPAMAQLARAPRLVELMGLMFASRDGSGAAPEEFWEGVVFPLLFIGAPATFPPLDDEELDAIKQGVDPMALYLDAVPYARQAPEEGLLGAIDLADVDLPHPDLGKLGAPRLLRIKRERLAALLSGFDPAKSKDALSRFCDYLGQKVGKPVPLGAQGEQMRDVALTVLADLQRLATGAPGDIVLRRMTEAEAMSEAALAPLRNALQGSRIILAT